MLKIRSTATCFVVLMMTSQLSWADVRATLSRQTIDEGDTVTLSIVTNNRQSVDPDLSVLQQDFDIVGTGSSQQTRITNGHLTEQHQWRIELAPKQGGELTVPSIHVGSETTQPLTLTVTAQPDAPVAEAGQSVFMKTRFEPVDSPVYVQQQIRYSLQLFYREKLHEGSIDEPQVENALVERLGNDVHYQTNINGMEYQVLERHYAIFPEQSGPLSVSPVVFSGRLAGESQQRIPSMGMSNMMERFFGNSVFTTPGKRIRLRSESITLDVQPRPATYTGKYWLPGEQLTLTDSWTSDPPEFRTGEPVTRTITLEAKGLESTHLPDIDLTDSAGMRLYPEKPVYSNRTDGEWVIGSSQQTIAYVPSATGLQTIPGIRIDWWDTTEEKQKTVELPAWTVNVLPGDGAVEAVPPLQTPPAVIDSGNLVGVSVDESGDADTRDWLAIVKHRWPWLLGGGLLLLLVLVLLATRRSKSRGVSASTHPAAKPDKQQAKVAMAAIQRACQDNNPSAAAQALLQWAAARWPDDPPRNLGALMQRQSSGVNEIQALEQALYGTAGKSWTGDALWREVVRGLQLRTENKPVTREGLSPLYPDWKT